MSQRIVLVTGGSGFIAGHCILQLLHQGRVVRATLRSLARETDVRNTLADAGMTRGDRLSFFKADLLQDSGWNEALDGVEDVLHVASPVRPGHVEYEDEVIGPAREGTLRVLRAARQAGVRRMVLTSAFHAVGWGHARGDRVFTEGDWTNLEGPGTDAYARSKTLAEQAAWEFVADGAGPELVTMLPVAVMGPVLGNSISGANHIVQRMLTGGMPALPDLYIPIVDVRDVAQAHVLALTTQEAAGHRVLLSNGPAWSMLDIAGLLREQLGDSANRVPRRRMPSLMLRLLGRFNPGIRAIIPDLGRRRATSNEKARRLFGWRPRPSEDAIIAAGESMARQGLVREQHGNSC